MMIALFQTHWLKVSEEHKPLLLVDVFFSIYLYDEIFYFLLDLSMISLTVNLVQRDRVMITYKKLQRSLDKQKSSLFISLFLINDLMTGHLCSFY